MAKFRITEDRNKNIALIVIVTAVAYALFGELGVAIVALALLFGHG